MIKYIFIALVAIFMFGCGGGNRNFEEDSVVIKDGKLISSNSKKELNEKLLQYGVVDGVKYGLKSYKISYDTRDINGKMVKASGVVIVPILDKSKESDLIRANGFAVTLDCHGTIFANSNAPSVSIENRKLPYGAELVYSALHGFITIMPDYLGYGDSVDSIHPYLLKNPTRGNIADFTKKAFEFLRENDINISPNEELYLSGYSEGGYVALASVKTIEQAGFNLQMSVPMAGPYLLEPFGQAVMDLNYIDFPSFVAFFLYSYAQKYHYSIANMLQEPYAKKIDSLFNKENTREQIDAQLTTKVKGSNGLLVQNFVNDYKTSDFRLKLIKNSILEVNARTPIKLMHCMGDDVVPYEIAKSEKSILKLFNSVELITIDSDNNRLNHIDCAYKAYLKAGVIFKESREKMLGY